ncbi:Six-hairpin glycosidase [Gloeophyllum trabeum ATCC 11539]|uniref:Six-hairpin glycosidase n=1 Tax=Gloeophyllum trabeum (strain ATCC 11539 / FP-39264 / Madison 617) TaxID=670483 RepID=S7QCI6_GLOTA|nr:Six-hairpin glycosidase [Gloeophyllum trabeum ATCC 11539]EPQ57052.1 Six-hairpin glycosidase [Gloeophyllum trabeum ATCC 11539]
MFSTASLLTIVSAAALFFSLSEGVLATPVRRAQCAATLNEAKVIADRLQSHWFNTATGQYTDGELWTDCNALEDLHNLMLAAGSDDYGSVADESWIGKAALNPNEDWNAFLGGSWDDSQWLILALWKIADYKNARGQDASAYLSSAAKVYDIVAAQWDDTVCGGGVWWSSANTYKNAITNELFLLTSASGYLRTGNQTYLDNANKEWNWLSNSGMRNSDGLFNDGLDSSTCQNNGQTTWTYNQAVVASGLGALGVANKDTSLFDEAEISLDASMSHLTVNGILKESCDDPVSSSCDHNQQIFKGIWTKHVQYYLDQANDAARTAKYSAFLGAQYSAIYHYGKNADNDVGNVWYAPSQGGSIFSPEASASGLAGIVADAKYGPC